MFLGNYKVTLDDKGRLAIPACFRQELREVHGNKAVIALEVVDLTAINLYTPNVWRKIEQQVSDLPNMGASSAAKTARWLQRVLLGGAKLVDIDDSGRILLSKEHRSAAGLSKKVRLVGQSYKLEIWAEEAWSVEFDAWLQKPITERLDLDALSGLSL